MEAAVSECKKTLAGNNSTPISDRIKNMAVAFEKFGIRAKTIEQRLGRKLDTMTNEDIGEYIGIYNSLKEGSTVISDWFDVKINSDRAEKLTAELLDEIHEEKGKNKDVQ
mgnify:FL=1